MSSYRVGEPHPTVEQSDKEARDDFMRWCSENRHLLGRDRLWPSFLAGWWLGHATAVDLLAEQHPATEDHDRWH